MAISNVIRVPLLGAADEIENSPDVLAQWAVGAVVEFDQADVVDDGCEVLFFNHAATVSLAQRVVASAGKMRASIPNALAREPLQIYGAVVKRDPATHTAATLGMFRVNVARCPRPSDYTDIGNGSDLVSYPVYEETVSAISDALGTMEQYKAGFDATNADSAAKFDAATRTVNEMGTRLNAATEAMQAAAEQFGESEARVEAMLDIQKGIVVSGGVPANSYKDVSVTFPKPFTDTDYGLSVTFSTSSTAATHGNFAVSVKPGDKTTAGCVFRIFNSSSYERVPDLNWVAFGTI